VINVKGKVKNKALARKSKRSYILQEGRKFFLLKTGMPKTQRKDRQVCL
jgi:hypothetical protein